MGIPRPDGDDSRGRLIGRGATGRARRLRPHLAAPGTSGALHGSVGGIALPPVSVGHAAAFSIDAAPPGGYGRRRRPRRALCPGTPARVHALRLAPLGRKPNRHRAVHPRPGAPRSADIAVTVLDGWQQRGIGGLLTRALARAALRRGIDTFVADVFASNTAALGLLKHAGEVIRSPSQAGVIHLEIRLKPTNSSHR